ncbi:hypothetical protein PPL_08202 [Heterostelium album PN500]|uniref:Uncharacterized protein n=1 Tax=Heterostelium pallidum (strain ATCC 26659 / Pp 5 / PN500) TaxID=670386 RepID=D3BIW7_HETP5|nr:hypothetical protein PPL_08202 [Heterostelium album PN500]EFA78741.1 hypothetical protein PPL_08202 [Heterostelium album PN500]|eukprot:XP_020430865.1 hypothetical protein PPL_08202 [Heterostelium album PN500]
MDDLFLRTKTNYIFEEIAKGGIYNNLILHFENGRIEPVKVYTDEKTAIDNFYNDEFIVIILFYKNTEERDKEKKWIRMCHETVFQKTGATKEYRLDDIDSPFSNQLSLSYIRILKRDSTKPRILQKEIEYPSIPKETSRMRQPSQLKFEVNIDRTSQIIPTPDLGLLRIVIRKYYQNDIEKRMNKIPRILEYRFNPHEKPEKILNGQLQSIQSNTKQFINLNINHINDKIYTLPSFNLTETITEFIFCYITVKRHFKKLCDEELE